MRARLKEILGERENEFLEAASRKEAAGRLYNVGEFAAMMEGYLKARKVAKG